MNEENLNQIPTEVIELNGSKPGPTSMVLGGVHGNETCGVEALNKILPDLKIEAGRVIFAYANPKAIEQKVRLTETNLNRMFISENQLSNEQKNSYEFKRAQYLKPYLEQSDALLDIHASSNPESQPFIICEKNSKRITDYLPIEKVVYGFDDVEPGGTDYYMNKIGKIGICVECGYMGEKKSTETAIESIITFLQIQGHILGSPKKTLQVYFKMYQLYKSKTAEFRLEKKFKDFEQLLPEQIIGYDGNYPVKSEKESIILFAKNSTTLGQEIFLLGEHKKNPDT